MEKRQIERRQDTATAERFALGVKTWRAFDMHAALSYLRLSGCPETVVQQFLLRVPDRLREMSDLDGGSQGRRRSERLSGSATRLMGR
jgi:hypothetical protein